MHHRKPPTSHPFPRTNSPMCNLLPKELQHVVIDVRQLTQADDDIIINSMLNAMAIAVQASTNVFHPFTQKPIPLSLYCISIAESGARKSTVDNILMAPFRHFEQTQEDETKIRIHHYEHEAYIYDTRLKILNSELRKAMKNKNTEDELAASEALQLHKKNKPICPPPSRILVSDITQPALQKALSSSWNSLSLNTDEAGKILNGRDFSMPSFYNKLWDATPSAVERTSTGRTHVNDYRFSMNLMLQPSLFAKYVHRYGESARESGFFARCLFALPRPSYRANRHLIEPPQTPHLTKFLTRAEDILNDSYQRVMSKQLSERRLLKAKNNAVLYDFEQNKERALAYNASNAVLDAPEFMQRATEHALRLAGVMHAFLCDEDTVSDTVLDAAIKMTMEYSRRYQQAIDYNELSEQLINSLLKFIVNNARLHHLLPFPVISKTLLLQGAPSKLRKKQQLDAALAILEHNQEISIHRISNSIFIAPIFPSFAPALSAPHVPGSSL